MATTPTNNTIQQLAQLSPEAQWVNEMYTMGIPLEHIKEAYHQVPTFTASFTMATSEYISHLHRGVTA